MLKLVSKKPGAKEFNNLKMSSSRIKWVLLGSVVAVAALKIAVIGRIPLSPDEAYYWTWAHQPAVCYFDQPGMVAWINWLGNFLPGAPSAFTVRLPAVILALLAALFAFFYYQELFRNEREALLFAIAYSFTPVFFFSGTVMIHDSVLIFFLAGFNYFCARLLNRPTPFTWLGITFFLLGSLYSKLNVGLVAVSFALYLLLSPFGRTQLRKPWPWLAGLLTCLGFLPVLIWNQRRGWPSLLAIRQLTQVPPTSPVERLIWSLEFVVSQFGAYSPLAMIGIIAAVIAGARLLRKNRDERMLLMLTLALPPLLYFLVQSPRSSVAPNWSIVGYFPLLALAAWMSMSGHGKGVVLNQKFYIASAALSLAICLPVVGEARLRLMRPLSWEIKEKFGLPFQPDLRLDMELEGWPELRDFILKNRQPGDLVSARRYRIASMLEYLLPDHPVPVVISQGFKHSQYNLWNNPADLAGRWSIFVDINSMPKAMEKEFAEVQPLAAPLWISWNGHPVKKFYIYRAYNYRASAAP